MSWKIIFAWKWKFMKFWFFFKFFFQVPILQALEKFFFFWNFESREHEVSPVFSRLKKSVKMKILESLIVDPTIPSPRTITNFLRQIRQLEEFTQKNHGVLKNKSNEVNFCSNGLEKRFLALVFNTIVFQVADNFHKLIYVTY